MVLTDSIYIDSNYVGQEVITVIWQPEVMLMVVLVVFITDDNSGSNYLREAIGFIWEPELILVVVTTAVMILTVVGTATTTLLSVSNALHVALCLQ